LDLIELHGKDSINEEGNKFWTGDKRFPHPISFNKDDGYSLLFVKKYAQILARSLSIPVIDDDEEILKIISNIKIEKYIPKPVGNSKKSFDYNKNKLTKEQKKLKIKLEKEKVENFIKEINQYFDSLEKNINLDLIKIEEFDKDDDLKGHVEFIYAFTNLRAENYNIEKCDISKVKMISGKIVPAIASTTAAIVGIVALQLYVLKITEDINYLRDCFFDLATNVICFQNLRKAKNIEDGNDIIEEGKKKYKLIPEKFSIWDYLIINESLSIRQLIYYMKKEYNVEVTSIISSKILLYLKNDSKDEILDKKIEDVYNNSSSIKLFENKKYLMLEISGEVDDSIAKMPLFKYIFKK
jgi:ubiquitin-activating enzyme E1